jgi:hypothetical protein
MPIDTSPGGTDVVDISGNGKGADINSDPDSVFENAAGLTLAAGKVYQINDVQVVGPRISGMPAAATDPATTMALVNFIRALTYHSWTRTNIMQQEQPQLFSIPATTSSSYC